MARISSPKLAFAAILLALTLFAACNSAVPPPTVQTHTRAPQPTQVASPTDAPATAVSNTVVGTFRTTITEADVQAAGGDVNLRGQIGAWELQLTADGKFSARLGTETVGTGTYTVSEIRIHLAGEGVCRCICRAHDGTLTFRFDNQLTFANLDDPCIAEVFVLTQHPWVKQ